MNSEVKIDTHSPVLTSVEGQSNLPRYFALAFKSLQSARKGTLDIVLPDQRVFRVAAPDPEPRAEIHVHDQDAFARLIREGDLGFSEAYLDGAWTTPDLQSFMDYVHADPEAVFDGFPGFKLLRAYEKLRFFLQSNTKGQARKNIAYHYDLGNDFYSLWLDPTMTYSSALFHSGTESLSEAQRSKYAAMIEALGVSKGDHVLEIGCGWAGFAEFAAREHGVKVTGITISQAQLDYGKARIATAGLSDLVDLQLCDYRDLEGQYDGVVSIEMFEAVGERYWPTYFDVVKRVLKPQAKACLQIITVADHRWETYRRGVDFIQKYIFPGGMLPAPKILAQRLKEAGLSEVSMINFAQSYGKTLRMWRKTFIEKWNDIEPMGFDTRFYKMWDFYFTSCASTFESGNCDVIQVTIQKS